MSLGGGGGQGEGGPWRGRSVDGVEVLADEAQAELTRQESRRQTALVIGGETAAEYLDSVPTLPSMELIRLVTGEPHSWLKEAATEELNERASILDEIIAERRQA